MPYELFIPTSVRHKLTPASLYTDITLHSTIKPHIAPGHLVPAEPVMAAIICIFIYHPWFKYSV